MSTTTTPVTLPDNLRDQFVREAQARGLTLEQYLAQVMSDLVAPMLREAAAMGLSPSAYRMYVDECRAGRLDAKAQDATRHLFAKHGESLKKLAQ